MGFAGDAIGGNIGRRVPATRDRRRSCRYEVLFRDALLGWPGETSFVELPARLIDLSLQGCALDLDRRPPSAERKSVRIRPLAAPSDDWAEGVVLSVRKPFFKPWRVRVAFHDSFPYQSFKKLVYGSENLQRLIREEAPPHEQDHYWR